MSNWIEYKGQQLHGIYYIKWHEYDSSDNFFSLVRLEIDSENSIFEVDYVDPDFLGGWGDDYLGEWDDNDYVISHYAKYKVPKILKMGG